MISVIFAAAPPLGTESLPGGPGALRCLSTQEVPMRKVTIEYCVQ